MHLKNNLSSIPALYNPPFHIIRMWTKLCKRCKTPNKHKKRQPYSCIYCFLTPAAEVDHVQAAAGRYHGLGWYHVEIMEETGNIYHRPSWVKLPRVGDMIWKAWGIHGGRQDLRVMIWMYCISRLNLDYSVVSGTYIILVCSRVICHINPYAAVG